MAFGQSAHGAPSCISRAFAVLTIAITTAGASAGVAGCGTPAPASKVPTARSAFDRIHATQDCGLGIHAAAKIDHFGKEGRIRGDLLAFAFWPDKLRMDIVSPFGVTLATLTSDGQKFMLNDLRDKRFLHGPATACNIARLTTVPVPGHVLVSLLRGEAPILKHAGETETTIEWDSGGYYLVKVKGTTGAEQRVKIAPHPDDIALPWDKQRLRVLEVEVRQENLVLYQAELSDHKPPAPGDVAKPIVDPDGLEPPIQPSGPVCMAEIPRRIHVKVPGSEADVLFRYDNVTWNPPLPPGTFTQPIPDGVKVERVTCEDTVAPIRPTDAK